MLTFGYGGVSFPSVCFKVYRQGWNKAWIKGIKPEQWFVVQPRWINDEDDSKATILALKVYVAWHQDIGREFKLDPSNIVVFSATSSIPLPDSATLTDIWKSVYGPNNPESCLMVVHKETPSRFSPIQWLRFGRWIERRGYTGTEKSRDGSILEEENDRTRIV